MENQYEAPGFGWLHIRDHIVHHAGLQHVTNDYQQCILNTDFIVCFKLSWQSCKAWVQCRARGPQIQASISATGISTFTHSHHWLLTGWRSLHSALSVVAIVATFWGAFMWRFYIWNYISKASMESTSKYGKSWPSIKEGSSREDKPSVCQQSASLLHSCWRGLAESCERNSLY